MSVYMHTVTLVYEGGHEQSVPTSTPGFVVLRGRLLGPITPDTGDPVPPIDSVVLGYEAAEGTYETKVNTRLGDPNGADTFVYRKTVTSPAERTGEAFNLGTRDVRLVRAPYLRWVFGVESHDPAEFPQSSDWADATWHHPSCQWYGME